MEAIFSLRKSTMEAIFSLWQLMEKYQAKRKKSAYGLHRSRNAIDKVHRDLIWWVLNKMSVPRSYIEIIKYKYEEAILSVRTTCGEIGEFTVTIGLHQGFALSPY